MVAYNFQSFVFILAWHLIELYIFTSLISAHLIAKKVQAKSFSTTAFSIINAYSSQNLCMVPPQYGPDKYADIFAMIVTIGRWLTLATSAK